MKKYFMTILFIVLFPINCSCQTLKVGISNFDPPFIMRLDKTHFGGFDIAMIEYLCKRLDVICKIIPFNRGDLLDAVKNGRVDLAVSGFDVNNIKASNVIFSFPYLISKTSIIGLRINKNHFFEMKLLDHSNIGIVGDWYLDQIKILKIIDPKVKIYIQDGKLIEDLYKGTIDFVLTDQFTAEYWNTNSSNRIENFGCPIELESNIAIAINPNHTNLQEQINKALAEYRHSPDFTIDYNKYFKWLHLE